MDGEDEAVNLCSLSPTTTPTVIPSAAPTRGPTNQPSAVPTQAPTGTPSAVPTSEPTSSPTRSPSHPYAHQSFVASFKPEQLELEYEGDQTTVIAAAVLEDNTRIRLSYAMGLVLTSNAPGSIVIADQTDQTLQVPTSPVAGNGPLVHVAWQPNRNCSFEVTESLELASSLFETNLTMAVSPPPAEDLIVLPAAILLVPSGGAAAAAGYRSSQALSVALVFPGGRRISNLQADTRVSYSIELGTAEDGAISIDDSGVITAGPAASNLTGTVAIQIEFEGQNVSASVAITITNYRDIEVEALPFPSYAGSTNVELTQISLIEDVSPRQWQQAQLQLRMTLMDGRNTLLSNVVLAAQASDESVDASISSGTTRVLTATAGGNATIDISGSFSGATTTSNLTIDVSEVAVRVVSVVSMRLIGAQSPTSNPTLTGAVGRAAQLALGVTLSDGRIINNAVANSGTINLPGLFSFTSANAGVLAVVASSGRVTLNNNYHDQITLTVQVGQGQRVLDGAALPTSCNLIANDAGDVDLGRTVGSPIASLVVGSTGQIEMRVHTGGQTLGSFHIKVFYNATALNMTGVTYRVPSSLGSLDQRTVIRPSTGTIEMIGSIVNSRVNSNQAVLASLLFTALDAGVHPVRGNVLTLSNNNINAQRITTNQSFVAGDVAVGVTASRRRRDVDAAMAALDMDSDDQFTSEGWSAEAEDRSIRMSELADSTMLQRERRQVVCNAIVEGDVNCDCNFDAADNLYTHRKDLAPSAQLQSFPAVSVPLTVYL